MCVVCVCVCGGCGGVGAVLLTCIFAVCLQGSLEAHCILFLVRMCRTATYPFVSDSCFAELVAISSDRGMLHCMLCIPSCANERRVCNAAP